MKNFAFEKNIYGQDIKNLRSQLGFTQAEMAGFFNISVKTLEQWEYGNKKLSGPIVALTKILREYPQIPDEMEIPQKVYPLRLWYMFNEQICTVIDVDERNRKVRIHNYTYNFIYRAFGNTENPTFTEYEEFLESRCFPRDRDKSKIILKQLGLPFYDPLLIIEKTGGRMAEDSFWIRIER